MVRYEIRAATRGDEEALVSLARHLNTVNLPHQPDHLKHLLDVSEQSFLGELSKVHQRYVFLLWDRLEDRPVGTSSIVAQHGTREAPYIYLDVIEEEKYSRSLDRHFVHQVLRLGFSYRGPTELAGLVVDPAYRGAPERLGLLISYVRFLYVAQNRPLFRDELLAELLPPLEPDGTSHLWEAYGRRFTGMSYSEADLLSSRDKTFIRDLFPVTVHASLFSPEARAVIGKVGKQTQGVEKMLRRVGFRYAERIDPFDGGPHFVADTGEVTLIRQARAAKLEGPLEKQPLDSQMLVSCTSKGPPYFRAVLAEHGILGEEGARLPAHVIEHLGLTVGQEIWVLPLAARRRRSGAP